MTTPRTAGVPRIVVTVGGDHHPFDRLMRWMERWLADAPAVTCVVQHGTALPPDGATARPFLSHAALLRLIGGTNAVVTSSGPSTMSECWRRGILPIAVPRQHSLGEAVDDHQLDFSHRMAEKGLAVVALTEDDLRCYLDTVTFHPDAFALNIDRDFDQEVADTVQRISELIEHELTRKHVHREHFHLLGNRTTAGSADSLNPIDIENPVEKMTDAKSAPQTSAGP